MIVCLSPVVVAGPVEKLVRARQEALLVTLLVRPLRSANRTVQPLC